MAKTVLDVLKDKFEEDKASALQFLGKGGVKTLPNTRKLQVWFGVSKPVLIM